MAFWWTGRGFLSFLFIVGTFGLFGAIVTVCAGDEAFLRWPWLWGIGLSVAAVVNWIGGSRLNRTPINPLRTKLTHRLTYRPRNRFLSLPMEIWSGPLLMLALYLVVTGLVAAPAVTS